nr:hypothetical protein 107 [Pelagibacteraceae bacterium]
MLGFNSKNVYQDEVGDLNSTATDIEFDLGDRFRQAYGALIGKDYSKEGLLKGAAKIRNEKLSEAYDPIASRYDLGPLTANYTGVEGKTEAQIKADISSDQRRAEALEKGLATGDLNVDDLSPTASAGTIIGQTSKGARERVDKETRRQEGRQDTQAKIARDERRFYENERSKDRAQERLLAAENNAMNLQFKYAQLAQSERVRAQERKDRAIMTLINGLGNLGAAFAI